MESMSGEFAGKIAVVTGGSEGLGRDFCGALVGGGCKVYFCAEKAPGGEQAAKELGPLATFVKADVGDSDQISQFAATVASLETRIDYLINNVAVDDRIDLDNITAEFCDWMWQINTRSYILIAKAFVNLLRAGTGKSIVNIGTTNYMIGQDRFSVYGATKSAILGLTRSLARELGPEGIRCNLVSPGWIMTDKQLREYVKEQDKVDLLHEQSLKM
jgi:NAD(P)-dependent dehydrogenase (short-subunit alcohol dehydrogenase family)